MAIKMPKVKPPSQRYRRSSDPLLVRARGRTGEKRNDPLCVAMHEAGHAVAAVVLGLKLDSVDVKQRAWYGGGPTVGQCGCPWKAPEGTQDERVAAIYPHIMQVFAGPLSEMVIRSGGLESCGGGQDLEMTRQMAALAYCEKTTLPDGKAVVSSEEIARCKDQIIALRNKAYDEAVFLVVEHRELILEVAQKLMGRKSLTGAEVAAIIEKHRAN